MGTSNISGSMLTGRRELELPELDDEFAKGVGEFESLEELETARPRRPGQGRGRGPGRSPQVRSEILDQVVDSNHFDVPRSMVARYIDSLLGGPESSVTEERRQEAHVALSDEAERL